MLRDRKVRKGGGSCWGTGGGVLIVIISFNFYGNRVVSMRFMF